MSKKDSDPWVRTFTVSDPIRHKKGYTLYKVVSKVFPRNSIEAVTQVVVWKRYNDFKKLHKALHSIHQGLYLKGIFPPFAKARFFGRFDETVIEERRKCALELLEFAGKYPPLFTSQVFVKFFEGCQSVDISEVENEKCSDPVLQPSVTALSSPSPNHDLDSNLCQEDSEHSSPLGGIWKHRQAADDISISSCTATEGEDEDDDHTTFTDDDASSSKPVIDLTEFDPVLQNSICKPSTLPQEVCNDWLLTAFQSCAVSKEVQELDGDLAFPKPFENHVDDSSGNSPKTLAPAGDHVAHSHESLKPSEVSDSLQEFDPLYNSEKPQDTDPLSLNILQGNTTCPPYILNAAQYINSAQQAEASMKYLEAFSSYKNAVDTLLQGIQMESCPDTASIVRRKVVQYLKRAEELYETHLVPVNNGEHNSKSVVHSMSVQEKPSDVSLRKKMSDLAKYRVIGILSRVLLVLDTITNSTCVVKVLRKSSHPQQQIAPNIAPRGIPFMVQLYEVYETSDAIYLILEYASGGRLWDYISSYLQRSPSMATDFDFQFGKHQKEVKDGNVYSARKLGSNVLCETASDVAIGCTSRGAGEDSVDSDLAPSSNCPASYVALFKNYLVASQKENAVSLAKCNIACSAGDEAVELFLDGRSSPTCNNSPSKHVPTTESQINFHAVAATPTLLHDTKDTLNRPVSNEEGSCLKSVVNGNVHNYVPCSDQTDLPTFLSGDSGKDFLCQKKMEQLDRDFTLKGTETSLVFETRTHATLHSSKRDIFSEMDSALSSAISRRAHLPESCVVMWAAEIVSALSSLHKLGIIWQDLMPENILLGSEGHILLTYQSQWNCVDRVPSEEARKQLYAAPEVGGIYPVTSACDWWSLGALLFELLTGKKLVSCHPSGITSHTSLFIPSEVSMAASDLLKKLLTHSASDRLGSGIQGEEDIKFHSFFNGYSWS